MTDILISICFVVFMTASLLTLIFAIMLYKQDDE